MKKAIVTTSWDDGHRLDAKLAELLDRYQLAATFYIAPENREIAPNLRLSKEQVRKLAQRFEIGAHTMTHPRLSHISDDAARQEIVESKKTLEDWTGQKITSFCYPGGDYTMIHETMVRDAGFSLARTVQRFATEVGKDPFALPTTVDAYRHWSDAAPIFKEAGVGRFFDHYANWDKLAIAMFDNVSANGGVFHLWGHSSEIEKNGDWNRLERVFKHMSKHPGVQYVTNKELV